MKKSLYVLSLLLLLFVVFFGGVRFNQRGASQSTAGTGERQILHYVDPMNPTHTTKEPGIAPCGMPMEPVYAEEGTLGGSGLTGSVLSTSPGAVKIKPHKQQMIGVQLDDVTSTKETDRLRALGRIRPDENRIFTLIAATDGWLEKISESTTGSLVKANQLLAQIKVYNYDLITWQQRYLAEHGQTRSISRSPPPLTRREQARLKYPGPQTNLPSPGSEMQTSSPPADSLAENSPPMVTTPPSTPIEEMAASPTSDPIHPPDNAQSDSMHNIGRTSAVTEMRSPKPGADHSQHMENLSHENSEELRAIRQNNPPSASRGRMELLNLGIEESQLKEFAKNGRYITHVDLRSPANGYVLERKVSPLQKIENGTECFRIADLSRVWVEVDLYDSEAKHIQPGMEARISLPKEHEQFTATVSEVLPRFDAVSRSLKVRLEMDNPELVFRPDMFVDVQFLIPLPEAITVPASAVIDSGKRKTVYVVMGEGVFEPREVATGWQTGERVEIAKGLQPGEKIVVSGNFLIDSESRMKLAAARLMEDKAAQPVQTQMPAVAEPAPTPTAAPTPAPHPTMPAADTQKTSVEKVKDPVCGMSVNQDQAMADGLTAEVDGKTYYFCSADCKEQFKQNPQPFLTEKTGQPMHTDVPAHGGHQHD